MLVKLRDVSKTFVVGEDHVSAVTGVSLEIAKGQFFGIYGPSGCGKTTLLNIIAGIEIVGEGSVEVAGETLAKATEKKRAASRLRNIGVVFQENNLLPEFTAFENVALPLLVKGKSREESARRAHAALASVGVDGLSNRRPEHMSGGQRQRIGIARALAGEQQLLVADEPTGALDSDNSRALFDLMRALCETRGLTVVLATHDPIAQEFASSVANMRDGKLL